MRDARQCRGNSPTGQTRVSRTNEILTLFIIPEPAASKSEMVSLGDVLNQTTIQKRKDILSTFLKENNAGKLSEENGNHFVTFFNDSTLQTRGRKSMKTKI